MRFLPTKLHGLLDYIVGFATIALPFMLSLHGPQRWILVMLGAIAPFYSLFTDYELGLMRYLSIRVHLLLDVVFAVAILLTPGLFDCPQGARWPNYAIGVLGLIIIRFTDTKPRNSSDRLRDISHWQMASLQS